LLVAFYDEASTYKYKLTGVVFPESPPGPVPLPMPPAECVYATKELIRAVKYCDNTMNEPSCLINICRNRLPILVSNSDVVNNSSHNGIDLSNKNILIRCDKECVTKC
jgi:hypothetical protein